MYCPSYLQAWTTVRPRSGFQYSNHLAVVSVIGYMNNCLPFEVFAATVAPLVGANVGEDNFVVVRVGGVCVSDLGDIIFVVTRVVVDSVV